MKIYEAPELFVDEYVADTMIASATGLPALEYGEGGGPKNNNADNNQNCWGCNYVYGAVYDGNACLAGGLSTDGEFADFCY